MIRYSVNGEIREVSVPSGENSDVKIVSVGDDKDNKIVLESKTDITLIAAEQDGRNAFLVEIDEKYVDVIVKRYIRYIDSLDGCFLIRNGEKIPLSEIEDYQVLQKDEELSDKA